MTVNGIDITGAEVQRVVDVFVQQAGGRIPAGQLARAIVPVRTRILEELVMRRVMLDEAAKENVTLSDEEFDAIKKELAKGLSAGVTVEDMLKRSGATEAELRDQMLIRKLLMGQAEKAAKATDEDAKAFYDENKDECFTRPEGVVPCEDIKDLILEELNGEKQVEVVQEYVQSVQEAAEIEIFDEAVIAGAEKYVEEAAEEMEAAAE